MPTPSSLPLFSSGYTEKQLLVRLQHQLDIEKIYRSLDQDPHTTGAGVIFIDANMTIVILREFDPVCRKDPIYVVLRELPTQATPTEFIANIKSNPRESRAVSELINTSLSCGSAILGWVVVFGSTAAIPISGGTSTPIVYLSGAAASASTLQCLNSGFRLYKERSGETAYIDNIDNQEWYQRTMLSLDLISLGGAAAAGATTIKMVKILQAQTRKTLPEILKGLDRVERKRLTREINRLNNPGASTASIKAMERSGALAKRYDNSTLLQSITLQLKDSIGATLTFTGSAASGSIRAVAIAIYEKTDGNER